MKVATIQKITNRVLEVTEAELENVGDCQYRVRLTAQKVNLENGQSIVVS